MEKEKMFDEKEIALLIEDLLTMFYAIRTKDLLLLSKLNAKVRI